MLIDNGADPNLPLGSGIGNVLCVMTTHMAHKIRLAAIKQSCSGESSSSSSSRETGTMTPIQLVDYLMIFGAHLTAPVKFSKDFVGVVTDFAHATFKTVCSEVVFCFFKKLIFAFCCGIRIED